MPSIPINLFNWPSLSSIALLAVCKDSKVFVPASFGSISPLSKYLFIISSFSSWDKPLKDFSVLKSLLNVRSTFLISKVIAFSPLDFATAALNKAFGRAALEANSLPAPVFNLIRFSVIAHLCLGWASVISVPSSIFVAT